VYITKCVPMKTDSAVAIPPHSVPFARLVSRWTDYVRSSITLTQRTSQQRNKSRQMNDLPKTGTCVRICTCFYVLLTVHFSIFISVINHLDAQFFFCFTISLFHASTCFEHMCSKHVEAWNKIMYVYTCLYISLLFFSFSCSLMSLPAAVSIFKWQRH